MNTVKALEAILALLMLAGNVAAAARKYQVLVETARADGRDISDAELATLKAESDDLTQETLALLR